MLVLTALSQTFNLLTFPIRTFYFFSEWFYVKFCIEAGVKSLNPKHFAPPKHLAFPWHLSVIHSSPVQRPPGGARGHGTEGADLFIELVAQMFRPTAWNLTSCEEANAFGHFFCCCFSVRFLCSHLKSLEYFSLHSSLQCEIVGVILSRLIHTSPG